MKDSDPKSIEYHLKSLFLCCSSLMSAAITALMKAYRFKVKLEICGKENPGYGFFYETAKKLCVDVIESDFVAGTTHETYSWLSDQTISYQRAWIPSMTEREGDFHVLFPFLFKYHTFELQKNEPSFKAPKVDSLYVAAVWALCFGPMNVPISSKVLRDLMAWENAAVITAHNYSGTLGNEHSFATSKISSLSEVAQMYLGFWDGVEAWQSIKGKQIEGHPINVRTRKLLRVLQPGVGSKTRYLVLVKNSLWGLSELPGIARNAWYLSNRKYHFAGSNGQKVKRCLQLRLQDRSEEEIRNELEFSTEEQFYKWQVDLAIDIKAGRLRDPYESWIEACEYFELEPSKAILESITEPQYPNSKPDSRFVAQPNENDLQKTENSHGDLALPQRAKDSPSEREFRHGPDFRSVVSGDGKNFSLTPRQADVIRILHDNHKNGTPEVSQAFIINEVYPDSKVNNLRRLFSDDNIWKALVTKGKRRDLFRLNIQKTE